MDSPMFQDQALVTLSVANGTRDSDFQKRSVCLTPENPEISIGRRSKKKEGFDEASDNFFFDCPVMSRHHATIRLDAGKKRLFLKDAGSLHGTFANDLRLGRDVDMKQLENGDVLRFGVNVDRGAECFRPYEVQATVKFGDKKREELPTVYRVPDETDIEDISSSDGENSTSYARNVLKENDIRPAQIPSFQAIDLTSFDDGDTMASLPPLTYATTPGPKLAPLNMTQNVQGNCVDLTKWDNSLPEFEIPENEAREVETKAMPPKPSVEDSSAVNDAESLGWDSDNMQSEPEDEEDADGFSDGFSDNFSYSSQLSDGLETESDSIPEDSMQEAESGLVEIGEDLNEPLFGDNNDTELEYIGTMDESTLQNMTSNADHGDRVVTAYEHNGFVAHGSAGENVGDAAAIVMPLSGLALVHEQEPAVPISQLEGQAFPEDSSIRLDSILNPIPQSKPELPVRRTLKEEFLRVKEESQRRIVSDQPPCVQNKPTPTSLIEDATPEYSAPSIDKSRDIKMMNVEAKEPPKPTNQLKRKASEISESTKETQTSGQPYQMVSPQPAEGAKRFCKAAEVIGYMAFGGLAAVSALVASAPKL